MLLFFIYAYFEFGMDDRQICSEKRERCRFEKDHRGDEVGEKGGGGRTGGAG